jgi:hypothetical protein
MSDPLMTHLEDHMAGAGLAIDLLQSMKARSDDQSQSRFAASILVDVKQGEKALHDFAKAQGRVQHPKRRSRMG